MSAGFDPQDRSHLTPLVGAPKRSRFGTWDLESKDGPTQKAGFTRAFMAGLYDGSTYNSFFDQTTDGNWKTRYFMPGGCVDRMMRCILQDAYRGWTWYAHNAGNFDFLFILPCLVRLKKEQNLQLSLVPLGHSGLLAIDVWKTEQKWQRWRFVDSVRLLPMTLEAAGKSFTKGRKMHDAKGSRILNRHGQPFTIEEPEDDPGWIPYNKQDCILLYDVLERVHELVEVEFGGEIGLTAPSTSIKTFRRAFLKKPIPREVHTHEFVRRSYVGGRTEVFYEEGHFLSDLDVNSSYPFQMTMDMPAGEAREWTKGEPPRHYRETRIGFCEVIVRVPDDIPIPPLPVKARAQDFPEGAGVAGKLVFPTGVLEGVWEWGELQNAIECGCEVIEWKKSIWFEAKPLLREFVETLYKYRNQAKCFDCGGPLEHDFHCTACGKPGYDAGLDAFAKLLANSGYGKFAQNPIRIKFYWVTDPEMPEGCSPIVEDDPDCQVWIKEEEADSPFIMPQISARITALGRVLLHKYAMEAKRRVLRACISCHSRVTFEGKLTAEGWVIGQDFGGKGRHGDEWATERIGAKSRSCPCGGALETRHGEVYYMDTDAVQTDVLLPTGSELGQLKDEIPRYSGFISGRFYGPKLYRLGVDKEYLEQPYELRRAMLERDRKYVKSLSDAQQERAVIAKVVKPTKGEEVLDINDDASYIDWDIVKAKGMAKKNRTAENLELLYQGAIARLAWIADERNHHPGGGLKQMPEELKKAGTVMEMRLEKLGTLARLVKRDKKGQPILKKGKDGLMHRQSAAFERGPLMRAVPKRLHLEGAKRIHQGDGTTRPYSIDMTRGARADAG